MKRNVLLKWMTVVALGFLAVPLSAQDTLRLTLEEALQIALSENLTVKIADKEITRTGYAKKGAYAALFPQVEFSANYQRTIKKQTMYMEGQAIQFGMDNSWSTGFSANMPIVSVSLWKSLKLSAMDVEMSVEKARSSRIDMVDQVQQAFFASLLAKEVYLVYKENYDNTVRNYNDIKLKYENGRTSKYDLLTSEVAMKNAEPNVYDAQNTIVLAEWRLKALLGIDLNTKITCNGNLVHFEKVIEQVSLDKPYDLQANSALKQLDLQMDMLDQTYKMQLAKYYPSLNLSFSWQWSAMTNNFKFGTFRWNPYSIGGLSLVIPIFSGGQRYHDLKQTRVQQEQMKLQRENTERELVVGIKQALSSMETAAKQYAAAQSSIEGARTGYQISEKRYEVGSGTLIEMDGSRLALLQAQLNLNQSIYNYIIAKSSLEKIIGERLTNKNN